MSAVFGTCRSGLVLLAALASARPIGVSGAEIGAYKLLGATEVPAVEVPRWDDFFTALPYWHMPPFEGVTGEAAVAMADPGQVYVVYLPVGGQAIVDLGASHGPCVARWFNPRHGKFLETFLVSGKRKVQFTAPDLNDWVLLLEGRH